MKSFLKNTLNEYIFSHKIKSISVNDDEIITISFESFKFLSGKKYLMIKNRETGRRIQTVITNNEGSFELKKLFSMSEQGTFDIYIKVSLFKKRYLKRILHNSEVRLVEFLDRKRKKKLHFFKTKNNAISFLAQDVIFNHAVKELKTVNENIGISGEIEAFEDYSPERVEFIFQRRDKSESFEYSVELKKGTREYVYEYDEILSLDTVRNRLPINARCDVFLQIKDENDEIIFKELVNMQNYKEFRREEERYLLNVLDDSGNVSSLYATMGKNSLALWYTDNKQFERTFTIAKGKSVYNETCELEKIDQKMVFFESFFGKSYSGNPKYIYEALLQHEKYKNYTFVWSYTGENPDEIPGNPIIVDRQTDIYYKYLAKSKYWVSNIVFPVHRKREGNIYLQTWHGTPLKKLGFDIDIEGPETLARENFYLESRNWDYLVSANSYSSEIFKRAFKFKKEVLEVGYPLNDIFYQKDLQEKIIKIKRKLNIPLDKKVILYAPTWRDNEMANSWEHSFNLKFDLDHFYEKLGEDYVLLLRMHHLVADALQIKDEHQSFVRELSKYDDIQELYIISDLLITDYSSVFFDFANSKKPMLFFAYDFELYKENIRGFYLDMEQDLPGPVIKTGEELLNAILHIDTVYEKYKEKYNAFYNKYCGLEDGNAANRVIEKVFE